MAFSQIILALICCGCLSAAEPSLTEEKASEFSLKKHTETLNAHDHTKFSSWILSAHPSPAKKALLTSTITSTHYPFTPTITWYKASLSTSAFDQLLNQTFLSPSVVVQSAQGNYNYTPDNAFWVDFANASHFGGGFRSKGNVQEERMFDEFPQLSDLAYVLRKSTTILPTTKNGVAEPFLVVDALRKFDVSQVPYGKALDSASPKKVAAAVVKLSKPLKSANIIGLAAKDYSKKHNSRYSTSDLQYHLQAALLGDLAALQYNNGPANLIIHTGRWGAGAFKNSLPMITALQILAAEMAFDGKTPSSLIVFHGIDTSLIITLQQEIVSKLLAGTTPNELLKIFKNRQNDDAAWRPQN